VVGERGSPDYGKRPDDRQSGVRKLLDQAVERLDQGVHPFVRDHAPNKQYPVSFPDLGNPSPISMSSFGSTPLYTTWTRLANSGQALRMPFA
jgi:hypothetical protein